MATTWSVGDRVEGGSIADDYDTGRVVEVRGDEVLVAWDSEVRTWADADELRPEGAAPVDGDDPAVIAYCAAPMQPWQMVRLWDGGEWGWSGSVSYEDPNRDGVVGDRATVLRMLREYRRTGAIVGAYLVDPADYADDDDSVCDGGPGVDEIDWTGIDDAEAA